MKAKSTTGLEESTRGSCSGKSSFICMYIVSVIFSGNKSTGESMNFRGTFDGVDLVAWLAETCRERKYQTGAEFYQGLWTK